jgi:hypothetical protein
MSLESAPPLPPLRHPTPKRRETDSISSTFKRDSMVLGCILAALGAGWTWRGKLYGDAAANNTAVVKEDHVKVEALILDDGLIHAQLATIDEKFDAINVRFDEQRSEMVREHQETREDIRALASGLAMPRLTPTPSPWTGPGHRPH